MLANFKKFGVAAAVAAALGASGAAQAITLGEPGNALLIPHVLYDSKTQVNTLIGIIEGNYVWQDYVYAPTSAGEWNTDFQSHIGSYDASYGGNFPNSEWRKFPTLPPYNPNNKVTCSLASTLGAKSLHWYFFNVQSQHIADGPIPVTCDDFVRFDWGFVQQGYFTADGKSLDGLPGYIVIADESFKEYRGDIVRDDGLDGLWAVPLYGAAYLIQGNWASEAYIPVLPLLDLPDAVYGYESYSDEVIYAGNSRPIQVNPTRSGMSLASWTTSPSNIAVFSLRYFLGNPSLGATTRFVLWFPDNNGIRGSLDVEVYDADEESISAVVGAPYELNVLDASKISNTTNDPSKTGPFGPPHVIPDLASPSAGPAINSGFVLFEIGDGQVSSTTYQNAAKVIFGPSAYSSFVTSSSITPIPRAGIAFSLIGVSGGNSVQVQTDLAQERGIAGSYENP